MNKLSLCTFAGRKLSTPSLGSPKTTIITALLALVALAGQGQIHYRIEGTIGDSTLNTRLLLNHGMSAMKLVNAAIDTLEVVNGKLIPKEGMLDEPGSFDLQSVTAHDEKPDIQSPVFIIEEGTIHIHFNPKAEEYKAPDTPLNRAFADFAGAFYPLLHGDSVKQQRLDSLMRSELLLHNDDVLGMQALALVFSHAKPEVVASWLDLMSPRIKAGDFWNEMKMGLSAMGVNIETTEEYFSPAVGEKFVDFAVEYNGKTTRLSDYVGRGKYVLADFWASWCGPCRMEIPNLIAVYNKYKDKGLEVIGIAAWDKPASSLDAIKDDGVPYPQIINSQEIATKAYNVRGIPHIILFAPDGTILARGLRGEDIEKKLVEIFKEKYDKKANLNVPTLEDLSDANPYTVPADWFTTGTITIQGRIEGYDAKQFGFTSMECYYEDVFEKNSTTVVLDITEDGSFYKKINVSYPIRSSFYTRESKVGFGEIPFFARPGETIDITVRKNERGQYECVYNNGSSRDVQRWLRSIDDYADVIIPLGRFKGKFAEANSLADTVWQNMMYQLGAVSRREGYTPMEVQLALADAQTRFAENYLSYAMYRGFELERQEVRDEKLQTVIVDSLEWKALRNANNYYQLHRIDFNNPLLFASSDYSHLLNRMQFAEPVRTRMYETMIDENGFYKPSAENERKKLHNERAALHDMMGTDKDNLMLQICNYKEMLNGFNYWRQTEESIPGIMADTTRTEAERHAAIADLQSLSNMMPLYLASFTNPYVHQKAEQFYARQMAQTELSMPLPADNPSADLIRSISAKYPGRFLIVDFWGMGCGPCRAAIQSSKAKRAELAELDDVKLVFIAGERTTEGSEAYRKYVKEWLADEETICITNEDFSRLQELFRFNGIPHYETITPDCRRVRDDLQVQGFYNLDYNLKKLAERFKNRLATNASSVHP